MSSLRGNGLQEICRELNQRDITNRGRCWQKNILHYLLSGLLRCDPAAHPTLDREPRTGSTATTSAQRLSP